MLLKANTVHETVHIDSVDKNTIMSTVNTYFRERKAQKAQVSIEIWETIKPGSSIMSNLLNRAKNILPVSGLDENEIVFIWQ